MTNFYTPPQWDIELESDAGYYELLDSMGGVVHMQQLRLMLRPQTMQRSNDALARSYITRSRKIRAMTQVTIAKQANRRPHRMISSVVDPIGTFSVAVVRSSIGELHSLQLR